jgi:hypothetical protein
MEVLCFLLPCPFMCSNVLRVFARDSNGMASFQKCSCTSQGVTRSGHTETAICVTFHKTITTSQLETTAGTAVLCFV